MPWREDNNIGNSYSNLFGDIEEFEIAHIYCRNGEPFNSKVKKYFQITEGRVAKSIFNHSVKTGKAFTVNASKNVKEINTNLKAIDKARILRWEIFFVIRDLIWFLGKWKSKELYQFVSDFKPDVIFGTLTYMSNVNRMMVDLQKKYNVPLILYSWDDVYSWSHFSWNPLFIIRKLYNRYYIRNSVKHCSLLYTITKEMQKEYSSYFNRDCKLLYKSYNFDNQPSLKKAEIPYHMVFMGNIGAGRWQALAQLAKIIHEINKEKSFAKLDIYTLSPVSEEMNRLLNIDGTSLLNPAVPQEKVLETMRTGDILIHVEPLNKREASFYRLSFSTKLVDYLYAARCVLGLGLPTATLSYIEDNSFGVAINDIKEAKSKLVELFNHPERIEQYGMHAWECGEKNHQRKMIKDMLISDFENVLSGREMII